MMTSSRPPPLVLIVYGDLGNGYGDYLRDCGFRVAEAHSASEAVARAVEILPDLIVLDYDLDGEVVAHLRGDAVTTSIPIVALAVISRLHERRGR